MTIKRTLTAAALAACTLVTAPARADEATDKILGQVNLLIWTLASPEGAAILALDNDVWSGLMNVGAPFMSPYAPALRKMALTKAPLLQPKSTPPQPAAFNLANSYSTVISFGDSMSDTGNMMKVTGDMTGWKLPMAPNDNGRFSNGPVVLEVMSNVLNKPLLNYAFGGGQSGYEGLVPVFALQIGMLKQIDDYITNLGFFKQADSKALYTLWTGPDDFYEGSNMYLPSTVSLVTNNVKRGMVKLYNKGARNFFVPHMPDLAITPSARLHAKVQSDYVETARKRSAELQASMEKMLREFARQYPAAKVRTFDTFTFSQEQYAQAARDGYNVTEACYNPPFMGLPGPVCATPDTYMFWDTNHPTARASLVIGEAFARAAAGAALPSK